MKNKSRCSCSPQLGISQIGGYTNASRGVDGRSQREEFHFLFGILTSLTPYRYVNAVVNAIVSPAFYHRYVKLPSADVPPEIEDNKKFYPFFRNAIAAIDGTHINATPPAEARARYRNRKGLVSQNVLIACTFDMRFSYVLSGWEGSAADGAVYDDVRRQDLEIPEGKYYLADAGFAGCDALLVPYRGVLKHKAELE